MEIKVLGLFDENHGVSFHTLEKNWHNYIDFISFIANSHSENYIVKYVNFMNMENVEFELAYNVIAHQKDGEIHNSSFNKLWNLATDNLDD